MTVTVTGMSHGAGVATLDRLVLSHTTPRPHGTAPDATATSEDLPATVTSQESITFTVRGNYALAAVGRQQLANLHLRAYGSTTDGEAFSLGINLHLHIADSLFEADTPPPGTD